MELVSNTMSWLGLKIVLCVVFVTSIQGKPQYSTTNKPTSTPAESIETTTLNYSEDSYSDRAIDLPTKEKSATDISTTEKGTTVDYKPYPEGPLCKTFDLPTDEQPPYSQNGFQPSRTSLFLIADDTNTDFEVYASENGPRLDLDQAEAASELTGTISFPDEREAENQRLGKISSGRGVIQTNPSHFHTQPIPEHRFLRPAPGSYQNNGFNNVVGLRPGPNRRPLRPIHRPIGGAQTVLQTRPTFGSNYPFDYDREAVLVATIRLPDPFAFTSFLDDGF